jgi:hypothetical protein
VPFAVSQRLAADWANVSLRLTICHCPLRRVQTSMQYARRGCGFPAQVWSRLGAPMQTCKRHALALAASATVAILGAGPRASAQTPPTLTLVGLDLSKRYITACALDTGGAALARRTWRTRGYHGRGLFSGSITRSSRRGWSANSPRLA